MSEHAVAGTILGTLRSAGIPLYAVVDGARRSRPLEWLQTTDIPRSSLYGGVRQTTLGHLAPYLLTFDSAHESAWLQLITRFWSRNCLYFVSSTHDTTLTRRHLRKSMQVLLPDNRTALFRFYDPRAWLTFCRIATREQMQQFFGEGIRAIHVEIEGGRQLMTSEMPQPELMQRFTGLHREVQFYAHALESAC